MATSLIVDPHLTHDSLGPSEPIDNPNGISIGSAIFCTDDAECPYSLQWDAPFPKNCPFPWRIWTLSNMMPFPGLTKALNLNSISIGLAVFAGLDH